MIQLRPYQERAIDEIRVALREGHRNVQFQLATGGGKTLTAGYMIGSAAQRGNDAMFICNRVELLDQTSKAFDKLGIRYSLIAPGYRPDYQAPVQIASIDTLKARITKGLVKPPKLVVWDECRSLGAAGWARVFRWFEEQGSRQLGLDATPTRLDGKGLDEFFSLMVCGPTYSELMAAGALVPFECYAPTKPDLTGVRTKGHDFDQEQLEAAVDKPQLVGDVVSHYLRHAAGKLGITFAVSRKHSEHLAAAYNAAGVPAAHIDGETDAHERRRIVRAFRRREILQLCNCQLLVAGFDVPGVEVISDDAPSQSLSAVLQKWGRGSRPDEENPAKDRCILLDHAGNLLRHGLPDEDRTWSLAGRPKGQGKKKDQDSVNVRQCDACYGVHAPRPICPYCGFEYPIQSREVEEVEGTLKKVTAAELKAARAAEREAKAVARAAEKQEKVIRVQLGKKARSLEELQQIERERGYQEGWAAGVWRQKAIARDYMAQKIAEQQAQAYRR